MLMLRLPAEQAGRAGGHPVRGLHVLTFNPSCVSVPEIIMAHAGPVEGGAAQPGHGGQPHRQLHAVRGPPGPPGRAQTPATGHPHRYGAQLLMAADCHVAQTPATGHCPRYGAQLPMAADCIVATAPVLQLAPGVPGCIPPTAPRKPPRYRREPRAQSGTQADMRCWLACGILGACRETHETSSSSCDSQSSGQTKTQQQASTDRPPHPHVLGDLTARYTDPPSCPQAAAYPQPAPCPQRWRCLR